jgi:hypothetical protein
MELEKSQLWIWTPFQICHEWCVPEILSPSCISLPVYTNRIEIRVSVAEAKTSRLAKGHSSLALFLHLQCSLLMQLEKSQFLIQTLFQICRKQCMPALANKKKQTNTKKGEKVRKKEKKKTEM